MGGFLELYDGLPPDLIRLSPKKYATLIASISSIRLSLDQWRQTGEYNRLDMGLHNVPIAWGIIETLSDSVPSDTHDLSFITDAISVRLSALCSSHASSRRSYPTSISGRPPNGWVATTFDFGIAMNGRCDRRHLERSSPCLERPLISAAHAALLYSCTLGSFSRYPTPSSVSRIFGRFGSASIFCRSLWTKIRR